MKEWLLQLRTLTAVNFYGYFREPAIIFWALVFPAGIAGVLGVAFQGKPPEIAIALVGPVSVQDTAHSQNTDLSRLQTDELKEWKLFLEQASRQSAGAAGELQISIRTEQEALLALKRGEIQLYARVDQPLNTVLENSEKFISIQSSNRSSNHSNVIESDNESKSPSIQYDQNAMNQPVQAHYDPNNPEARISVLALQQALNQLVMDPNLKNANPMKSVALDQVGGRYIDFLIPGLLALGIMNSCMWGVGYGLIDLRVKKLLRRMAASPMHKSAFLASHFVARMAFTLSEALILFTFAHFLFDVSVQGSLPGLMLIFLTGTLAWSGIGILCSSRGRSMHAANGIVNAVTLPLTMLSGIFFSYRNFPEWSQEFIQWLPLTVLADSARALFIEGAGFSEVLLPALVLAVTGVLAASLGLKIYKWH